MHRRLTTHFRWVVHIGVAALTGSLLPSTALTQELSELDCLIEPQMTIELASPVDGVIDTILVDKGDSVKKGQVLAKLQATVEEAQLQLAQDRALRSDDIRYHQANSEFTQRRMERFKNLPEKKVISVLDVDEAETQATLARLQLVKARTDKHIAELELQQAVALLEQRTIRSPVDGIVVQRYLQPGESTEDKAIVKLAQINPLKVEAFAPASLVGSVTKGMQAELTTEVPTANVLKSTVTMVDPVVDAASGSFGVRLALPNPDNKPLSGLKCKVHLLAAGTPPNTEPVRNQGGNQATTADVSRQALALPAK